MDYYKLRLKHALWTWREACHCNYHRKPRIKDRASGRNDKRSARQQARREIDGER